MFSMLFLSMFVFLPIFEIHGPEMQCSESSQISISHKFIFGQFEAISFNV